MWPSAACRRKAAPTSVLCICAPAALFLFSVLCIWAPAVLSCPVQVNEMATEIKPMLANLKDGELLHNLERLTGIALEAANDIRCCHCAAWQHAGALSN